MSRRVAGVRGPRQPRRRFAAPALRVSLATSFAASVLAVAALGGTRSAAASDPPAWYVSFHGGSGKHALNDVHAFDASGDEIGKVLETHAAGEPDLRELRDIAFGPDGNLWVVDAYKDDSRVLVFGATPGADGRLPYLTTFVQLDAQSNPGMVHPFDLAFDADGDLYVSSQDTMLVTRYWGPDATGGTPGTPMPLPSGIVPANPQTPYPPGTFVPSAKYTNAAAGVLRSVRGIAFAGGSLFVADESASQVYEYDAQTGAYAGGVLGGSGARRLSGLGGAAGSQSLAARRSAKSSGGPIHLLLEPDGTHLLIGTSLTDGVLRYHLTSGKVDTCVAGRSGGLSGPAGMAFDAAGDLYVASRKSQRILRYAGGCGGKPSTFVEGLPDDPEFVLPVGGTGG